MLRLYKTGPCRNYFEKLVNKNALNYLKHKNGFPTLEFFYFIFYNIKGSILRILEKNKEIETEKKS